MAAAHRVLRTWSGKKEFKYSGTVESGVRISCGQDFSHDYEMTAVELRQALIQFSGREAKIGTHRTAPPDGSIGDWIQKRFRKGGIMSYVGPILIEEGYAVRVSEPDRIYIKAFSN